ncbi:hypothetical protein [Streptomyces sp. NPDC017940]|uniref:hypothetical protein n=1 Tax=Streptomyces sp. NPDC017940 TaxID=3365017 RepID=UPI0037B6A565
MTAETAGFPEAVPAAAELQELIEQWTEGHGVDAVRRLAEAGDLAEAVVREITPDNTTGTYAKSRRNTAVS